MLIFRFPRPALLSAAPLSAAIALAATLAACAPPLTPQQKADQNKREACERYASDIYKSQNREQLSREDQTGTPFSAYGSRAAPSAGLSEEHDYNRTVASCISEDGPGPSDSAPGDIRASTDAILNARH